LKRPHHAFTSRQEDRVHAPYAQKSPRRRRLGTRAVVSANDELLASAAVLNKEHLWALELSSVP
jgi:hypothetical protein